MSFRNRFPLAPAGWVLHEQMEPAYRAMIQADGWQSLERYLDPRFLAVKMLLDGALAARAAFAEEQLKRIRMLTGKI